MSESLIQVLNVSKTFKTKEGSVEALKNISLNIEKGDIFGIIGMSGAGKSTLVRCLNFLEKPTDGDVVIDGKSLGGMTEKELRKQRTDVAMIFQHFNLLMQSTVLDNVLFPMRINKKPNKKKAMELLKEVGLEDKASAYPAQLSGGQQQRVAIARALANDPRILLCDEATSALDPKTTGEVLNLLKKINETHGITIVIITHSMSVVQEICNRVAIIDKGRVAEVGDVLEVFSNPQSEAAMRLVLSSGNGEIPEMKGEHLVRIVFTENSSYEPVVANMVLKFSSPVNIMFANTRDIGGIAQGQMVLQLPDDESLRNQMIQYLKDRKLEVQELSSMKEFEEALN
ncbi:D-methionine transport system ATP-binding protein [Butyrivibrio fibrisolvens]|jgi:D-methionine transport system ATP-binding protein|uniref:ABC transporter n=1 Tax=Butyrivibrio fibrisolvens TaxID=831 RepID=A0A1H9PNF3_BUTFI|nr:MULTISPECIES: ATP-binding cassette domain-containing protein [Butyrivibrio]MCR4635281.1 ATP-binding cassette domain-containing protein [Butyrivibrio sp.]PWT27385.1 ABC transporter [Butyrivibrio fibrisolvens]SEQ44637.1 D-methionine transport system ATP-binding protein [Butyrivibrio sp. TB]SER49781.1 D-methionine transport system ATP-binding protein [Butyrivibrio fibrisolvens]